MAVNTWAASLMRYGAGIIKRNVAELDEMDRKTRKNHDNGYKKFQPKIDIDRLYVQRRKKDCKNCVVGKRTILVGT